MDPESLVDAATHIESGIVCPHCKASILLREGGLTCQQCGVVGSFREKVYDFIVGSEFYWGELSQSEMQKILSTTAQRGWRSALHDVVAGHPELHDYLLNPSRLDWLFHCLDIDNRGRCLDLGSGWGVLSFGLSGYFDTIWSLEAVKERIQFQRLRAEQDHTDNVKFVRSNWLVLPFPDDHFDLVVANGVLEWVGVADPSRNPRDVQISFLKEVYRVLKPGGCLYIGIENRFGLTNLRGGRDHSGLRFTSVVPRWIANWMVRIFRNKGGIYSERLRSADQWQDYRTYTYSQWGYLRLLKDAGFQEHDIYWTLSYNHPKYAGPCDGESFAYFLGSIYRSRHWIPIARIPLLAWSSYFPTALSKLAQALLSPCFLIYAYKDHKGATFESVLLEVEAGASSFLRISGSYLNSSNVKYFLLNRGKLRDVVKFPRSEEASERVAQEEALLARFNPVRVKTITRGNLRFFLEPPLDNGPSPQPYSLRDNLDILDWLIDFQSRNENERQSAEIVGQRIDLLKVLVPQLSLGEQVSNALIETLDRFLERLEAMCIASTAEHGDFWIGNISTLHGGRICVVDWECFQEFGDPFSDLTFFLLRNCDLNVRASSFRGNLVGKGKFSTILLHMMHRFSINKRIPVDLVLGAFPYTMLQHISRAIEMQGDSHPNVHLYSRLLSVWFESRGEIFNFLAKGLQSTTG